MALSNEGKNDEAIAKFNEVIAAAPNAPSATRTSAPSTAGKKDYDKAEAAYKKAIEVKPDFAEAYNGLANVYNAEKKFDLAAEASAKAMELMRHAAPAGGAPAAAAPPSARCSTRASSSGTPARSPRRRQQFEAAVRPTRTWPRRTTGSAWRW